jgi:hypothetical protein
MGLKRRLRKANLWKHRGDALFANCIRRCQRLAKIEPMLMFFQWVAIVMKSEMGRSLIDAEAYEAFKEHRETKGAASA